MRILEVNTFHFERGGDSLYALGISRELRSRGHEVRSFAMSHPMNTATPESDSFAIEVDYPALLARGGLVAAAQVMKSAIYNRDARRRIGRVVESWRPDVAHLHSVMHHLTASVVLELRKRNVPIVWTLHDAKSVCPTTLLLRNGVPCDACAGGKFYQAAKYRCKRSKFGPSVIAAAELYLHRWWKIYENVELLITPSQFLRNKILEMGVVARRLEVVPNFVRTVPDRSETQDEGYYLFVGRLSREKGVATLLDVAERDSSIHLRIAGSGDLGPALQLRAANNGLGERVVFLGHLSGEALAEQYRNARAILVPSVCYENCPLVVLEAFSHGKAVIASRLGGLPELVVPGETGDLVEAGDVDSWLRTIRSHQRDPETLRSYGEQARRDATSKYGAATHVERIQELLEGVGREAADSRNW